MDELLDGLAAQEEANFKLFAYVNDLNAEVIYDAVVLTSKSAGLGLLLLASIEAGWQRYVTADPRFPTCVQVEKLEESINGVRCKTMWG